jgi:LmbE family N-acetylglucosaminyl deacetylase
MAEARRQEQRKAADLGSYAAMIQLDYPSAVARDPNDPRLRDDIKAILEATRPGVLYTHNPADKHETHVAIAVSVIRAIREMPRQTRPGAVHGCEVWRDLDWMPDGEKVIHDVSGHESLAARLGGVFDSQIAGGKRYDLAVMGRRRANATFQQSHVVDQATAVSFAMDLTPLVMDETLDVVGYVTGFIERFKADVTERITRHISG